MHVTSEDALTLIIVIVWVLLVVTLVVGNLKNDEPRPGDRYNELMERLNELNEDLEEVHGMLEGMTNKEVRNAER